MKWDPYFYRHFPGYESILPFWKSLAVHFIQDWPAVVDYNEMAKQNGCFLRFVLQQRQMYYVEEIYHSRTIPMRPNLWHDFFNNVSWLVFPRLKWAIVQKYYQENSNRAFRTPRQNLLTQLDECGMIFCSDQMNLFDYIHQTRWKELFADRKQLLNHGLPIIVGHGIMEKALSPYVGMTAKTLFLQVPRSFFDLNSSQQLAYVDEQIAQYIMDDTFPVFPKNLAPFPVLGWPGWYCENENPRFYENSDYFRTTDQRDFAMQFKRGLEKIKPSRG